MLKLKITKNKKLANSKQRLAFEKSKVFGSVLTDHMAHMH
jgi:hypothetical protein